MPGAAGNVPALCGRRRIKILVKVVFGLLALAILETFTKVALVILIALLVIGELATVLLSRERLT